MTKNQATNRQQTKSLLLSPLKLGKTMKNVGRLRVILAVLAKHGLSNLVERINLGNFLNSGIKDSEKELLSVPTRLRMSFEELGPTFVKFGQLLATRPDLVPQDFIDEMSILHDQVQPLPFNTITDVISEELGSDWQKHFKSISENVLGSASIAQVHLAELQSGAKVVLKVQRPGILLKINDDLNVLYFIAELIEKYIPEARPFNPVGMVDEYFKTLQLETNFIVEANNIRRFKENFKDNLNVIIPEVHFPLTTERVLTMQAIDGKPLSQMHDLSEIAEKYNSTADKIIEIGLKAYLKMVFVDGFFHGDLHPGNFFILRDNKIGLVDFGVVGRLNFKTQSAIVNMLMALSKEDYLRLAYEYVDLAPYSDQVNVDLFAKELQAIIAPYFGLTLKNINVGKILLSSSSVAARHGLSVPTELMLFFKSIISIESLGQKISKDFDFLAFTLTQVNEVAENFLQPVKVANEASLIFRESRNFVSALPRQLNLMMRKMNSPDYRSKIQLEDFSEFKDTFFKSFTLLFLGIVIAALLISSTLLYSQPTQWIVAGMPGLSFVGYVTSLLLGVYAASSLWSK